MKIEERIKSLKLKLENQVEKDESYEALYKTSVEIDKLLVEYYKQYGLNGAK